MKDRFKVYLKYNSLLNSSWNQRILETYNYFSIIFLNLQTLEVNMSPKVYSKYPSYLEYIQKYI